MKIYSNSRNYFPEGSDNFSWRIQAEQKVEYSVEIQHGIFEQDNNTLLNMCLSAKPGAKAKRCLLVVDSKVNEIYENLIRSYFKQKGIECFWMVLPGDEEFKTLETTLEVVDKISEIGLLRRSETIIAIGGGVAMDVVGFASSLYRRGVTYIKIPTTLMGQIDAGIGVKTGINYNQNKNRLGTYYASTHVLIDPMFLGTLDLRHIRNGVAEIIKMAIVKDLDLFEEIESRVDNLSPERISINTPSNNKILFLSITGMLEELEINLWEKELKRLVDFGHTFSPLLEMCAEPKLLHGEAVAIDMALSIAIAIEQGLLSLAKGKRCLDFLLKIGLPIMHPNLTFELANKAIEDSIQHRDGFLRMPLPVDIGKATFVDNIHIQELKRALEFVRNYQLNESAELLRSVS